MTDATGYVARPISGQPGFYQFTLISRFQNRSDAPVYLHRCFPTSPQPKYGIGTADSAAGESAYNPTWACVGGNNQFEILPGAVRVDTFVVQGPSAFDANRQVIGAMDGVFRLILIVSSGPDGQETAVGPGSNAFVVRTSK